MSRTHLTRPSKRPLSAALERRRYVIMDKILFLILMFPFLLYADEKKGFSCEPIEGEVSFRIKGYFFENAQGDNLGMAHSYAVFGEYEAIEFCRVPWYEKFPLSGSTSAKMLLHWREYMPGCVQRFHIPTVSAQGYMWVEKSEDARIKSKRIKANCKILANVK